MSNEIDIPAAPNPAKAMTSGENYVRELAKWKELIRSGMLPDHVNTPQKALVLAMKGAELGWKPMQSFSAMHVISGKVEMSSEAMLGLIHTMHPTATIRTVEHSEKTCKLAVKRHPDDVENEVEFTWTDAERAGLTRKKVWQEYPKDMLRARCVSRVRRYHFPDTGAGVYTEGEIGGADPVRVVQIPDEEIVDAESTRAGEPPEDAA